MTQTNDDKVHVETYVHVAFPPTQYDIDQIKEKLRRSARMICDATDGKVLIDKIYLERNGQSANNADVLWLPEGPISRYITSTGGNRFGHPVAHFRVSNEVAFRAVAHEFGHLLFRLGDQYDRQRYFPNSGCGIGPSIQDTDVTITNHSIMQEYDTWCADSGGSITNIKCNDDGICPSFHTCYEFSPLASEFNTNNSTFEHVRGDTDDGIAWPGVSPGEKLWLDSRFYVNLTANWAWADRSIEFIDEVGNLALQSSHRIWLRARKVAANTYELQAYMGASTSTNDDDPLIWSVNSTDTNTLTLEFDPTATNCGKKPDPLNASLLEINGHTTWAIKLEISAEQLVGDSPSYTGGDAELDVDFENVCERDMPFPYLTNIPYEMDQATGGSVEGSYIGRAAVGQDPDPLAIPNLSPDAIYQQLPYCGHTDVDALWNGYTQRWETSEQYRDYQLSDWELIEANLFADWGFSITAPGTPNADPATDKCHEFEPEFDDDLIDAADTIALLVDRSKSMADSWQNGGVTQPKITWARAGAHGFALAGQGNPTANPPVPSKNLWLSVATFNHEIDVMPNDGILTPNPPPGVSAADVDHWTDLWNPHGQTAIGDAIIHAVDEMLTDPNAKNAIFLLTDGENNHGATIADASLAAQGAFGGAGIPVFISPIGTFDASTLDGLASATGGMILPAVEPDEMPASLFLMRAIMRGEDLSLLHEHSVLSKSYQQYLDEIEYDIQVESGAERLVLLLTPSADILSSWAVDFELTGPQSEVITEDSVEYVVEDAERYFYVITVPHPSAGTWTMRLEAPNPTEPPKVNPEKQLLMAHVEHEGPRCRVAVSETLIDDDNHEVTVFAQAEWNSLVGEKAVFTGEVRRPDGTTSSFSLQTDSRGTASGTFSDYNYDGAYLVKVKCDVASDATFARGHEDYDVPNELVPDAFERTGMAYFVLDAGIPRPLGGVPCSPNGHDADSDGVPDACDPDFDGDDLPNSMEGTGDTDGDGTQDAYDRDSDNDGELDGMDREPDDPVAHRRFAVGDFNGDGNEDLAWGEPTYNSNAGRVAVDYAGESSVEYWRQGTGGILETSEAGDLFGAAVAAGDFDGDGYDDLAIGAPGETFSALTNAGAIHIIYGSPSGLTDAGDQYWDEETDGILGDAEAGDKFGSRLTVGDYNCDGYVDVAPGAPDEAVGTTSAAGAVHVLYGSSTGVSSVNDLWFQGDSGVNGTSEAGDRFGDELVSGDFDGDTCDDLVIGSPFEDFGGLTNAGDAYVIYGTNSGLDSTGDWTLVQGVLQHPAGNNDKFSTRMWVKSIDQDSYDDLVIMSPNDCGSNGYKGFNYVFGSSSGLSTVNNVWYCREDN